MLAHLLLSIAAAMDWTLAMQLCPGASDYTLHGLWPESGNDCRGTPFDASALSDIQDQMKANWPSCRGHGGTNAGFWAHEWQKHGTCSGMDEKSYFATALQLLRHYGPSCSGGTTCELDCTGEGNSITCTAAKSKSFFA